MMTMMMTMMMMIVTTVLTVANVRDIKAQHNNKQTRHC